MDLGFVTLFFNISGGEIFIILLVVFIVFGPSKIPEVARSLGRMMNEVKKASSDISREFRKETSAMERDLKKTSENIRERPGSDL
jgi:sec-independent protein translocase protein TatA